MGAADVSKWLPILLPYAQQASHEIKGHPPVSVILAQWMIESGLATDAGPSKLALIENNWGGMKWVGRSTQAGPSIIYPTPKSEGGAYARFGSLASWTADYVRALNWSGYSMVHEAGATQYADEKARALAFAAAYGASPYAGTHYGGGKSLTVMMDRYNLYQYDQPAAGQAPPPAGQTSAAGTFTASLAQDGGLLLTVAIPVALVALVAGLWKRATA